jgi:nucleotide-binding universal stress UspA family protein
MTEQPALICYDGSPEARRAIDIAAELLGPRPAVVLDVAPLMTTGQSFAAIAAPTGNSSFADYNEADARRRAEEGAERAREAGFAAAPRSEVSPCTWRAIVDVAREIGAAVVVLGSRGQTGAREALGGSVSHEVAAHAGRPVLVIPYAHTHRTS